MTDHAEKFKECCSSPNLRERHDALIELVEEIVPSLNEEIGPIGGGAIREILALQEKLRPLLADDLLPFSLEEDGHNTYLTVTFGQLKDHNKVPYPIGIRAETPWHNEWYYQGYGGSNEGIADEVRELSRMEVSIAARRLAIALVILDMVFPSYDGSINRIVRGSEESGVLPQGLRDRQAALVIF